MPDGRRVKERTVTSYEDLDEPVVQAQQSKQVNYCGRFTLDCRFKELKESGLDQR